MVLMMEEQPAKQWAASSTMTLQAQQLVALAETMAVWSARTEKEDDAMVQLSRQR